jgi:hypothetical protein
MRKMKTVKGDREEAEEERGRGRVTLLGIGSKARAF